MLLYRGLVTVYRSNHVCLKRSVDVSDSNAAMSSVVCRTALTAVGNQLHTPSAPTEALRHHACYASHVIGVSYTCSVCNVVSCN